MSRSVERVSAAALAAGLSIEILELTVSTKTAQQAADAISVDVDQIAKSIIFRGEESGKALLFLTAGGNRVDPVRAAAVAGEALGKADADFIRTETGFAIGGVSPLGHVNPVRAFMDRRLTEFAEVWAAAGTPKTMFKVPPDALAKATSAVISDFTEER